MSLGLCRNQAVCPSWRTGIFLAWLFSEKTWGIARALSSSLSGIIVVQKLWHFVISLLLLMMFTLNSEYMFTIQRAIHTIKRNNSKCIFFQNYAPDSTLLSILYQAPHSRALGPACGALAIIQCFITQTWLLTTLGKRGLENIMRKGEDAGVQHFLLYPSCFFTRSRANFCHMGHLQFGVCKCFWFRQVYFFFLVNS